MSSLNLEALIHKQLKSFPAFICPDIMRKWIRIYKNIIFVFSNLPRSQKHKFSVVEQVFNRQCTLK